MDQKLAILTIAMYASGADDCGDDSTIAEAIEIKNYFVENKIIEPDKFLDMLSKHRNLRPQYNDFDDVLEDAINSLPDNLRKTAFALAIKVAKSDGDITENEGELINSLGKWLEISQADIDMIIEVLEIMSDKPKV